VAQYVASFLDGASASLDLAIYDLRLADAAGARLEKAVHAARARGVRARVLFNVDHAQREPDPVPPSLDWAFLRRLDVPVEPISGVPDLMHHKYVVRDAGTPAAAVLTGTANWTNDSWTREENVFLQVPSMELAGWYERDFEELWLKREVAASGHFTVPWLELPQMRCRAYFCPGRGARLAHAIAHSLSVARRRIRILSPVITSGPILGTLAEVVASRPEIVAGGYDLTQMEEVQRQWAGDAPAGWKLQAFRTVDAAIAFGKKRSTPWQPNGLHDFMHAKAVVADDTVFVGSYNLSHSGEENAENVLEIESSQLASTFAAFIESVIVRYGGTLPADKLAPV
jgi:phosphatidylserine/phosphatidylglycerophosphate/cardiolipin synthase-like enzyme